MDHKSIKVRFLTSLTGNGTASVLNFLSGVMMARALGPDSFGDITFLLASFLALRALLDPGVTSAYFTFISKQPESRRLHLVLAFWFTAATALVCAAVLLLPARILNGMWLGQPKNFIILAFLGTMTRQVLWQLIGQAGESARNTLWVQMTNVCASFIYVAGIAGLWLAGYADVQSLLLFTFAQYAIMSVWALWLLRRKLTFVFNGTKPPYSEVISRYAAYCKPLAALAVLAFLYDFLDRWFLQKFAGSVQQGFFQVALQFSMVSLLAVRSMLNIFWKEIAQAHNDNTRIGHLFNRTTKMLVFISAAASGMCIPWSREITLLFFGQNYANAWPIMALMFIYPIYQSAGQIVAVTFNACENNTRYTKISLFMMGAGIITSYLFLAPATRGGLGMGAAGLAVKIILVSIISVNAQIFILTKLHSFKFDWKHQALCILTFTSLGYLVKIPFGHTPS
ncbi:MAG: lipopolysaccharide biosynthesis protein, partial [Elusimicrobiaceae bacterium]